MGAMFYCCKSLRSIDLSRFRINNVSSLDFVFANCENLISLDISNFDFSNIKDAGDIIYGCKNLRYIKAPRYVHRSLAEGLKSLSKYRDLGNL